MLLLLELLDELLNATLLDDDELDDEELLNDELLDELDELKMSDDDELLLELLDELDRELLDVSPCKYTSSSRIRCVAVPCVT